MTFETWFNENEGFHLRSERLWDDVLVLVKSPTMLDRDRFNLVKAWMEAAYQQGQTDYYQNTKLE